MRCALEQLIHWVFGDFSNMGNSAILAATNEQVRAINALAIERFPGEAVSLASADSVTGDDEGGAMAVYITQEYLNGIHASGLPPHLLQLKIGMPVILLRNLNAAQGLCNGTRLIVQGIRARRLLEAAVCTGPLAGQTVLISRLPLSPAQGSHPFEWQRTQFPVQPAFCMTINKAQGQSLARVGVFLDKPVFSHGQLYVAASRVTSPEAIRFAVPNGRTTDNVVYREVIAFTSRPQEAATSPVVTGQAEATNVQMDQDEEGGGVDDGCAEAEAVHRLPRAVSGPPTTTTDDTTDEEPHASDQLINHLFDHIMGGMDEHEPVMAMQGGEDTVATTHRDASHVYRTRTGGTSENTGERQPRHPHLTTVPQN